MNDIGCVTLRSERTSFAIELDLRIETIDENQATSERICLREQQRVITVGPNA